MKTSNTIEAISAALAKAQGKLKTVVFNKTNPYFNSRYADLTAIVETCKAVLEENELAVIQGTQLEGTEWTLVTRLQHSSGQFYESCIPLFLNKKDMQSLGSAITYARRYGWCAMLGLSAEDDDDANASVKKTNEPEKKRTFPQSHSTTQKPFISAQKAPHSPEWDKNDELMSFDNKIEQKQASSLTKEQDQGVDNGVLRVEPTKPALPSQIKLLQKKAFEKGLSPEEMKKIMFTLTKKEKSSDLKQEEIDRVYDFICRSKPTENHP